MFNRNLAVFITLAALALASPARAESGVCRDPWVTQAIQQVTGRSPDGSADLGECNYRLYGGGQWNSYPDLLNKVRVAFAARQQQSPAAAYKGVCRDAWVTQAIREVAGRNPNGTADLGECNYKLYGGGQWNSYPDLVNKVRVAFGVQVPQPSPPAPRQPTPQELAAGNFVDAAYTRLLQRAADPGGRNDFINRMLNKGWSPEDVWTAIAQSQERLQRFGFWAPAKAAYSGHRELCFGAIGPKCDGAPKSNPVWVDKFIRPDGVEMGYIQIQVSVGSILHDNSCLRVGGQYCDGLPAGIAADAYPLFKYMQPSALEWNKAVYNTIDNRFWTATFGPYPTNKGLMNQFSDDLTPASNRTALMAPIMGYVASPYPAIPYTLGETRQTLALKARAGTAVDRGDAAYCASGSYREDGNALVQKFWGVCN